MPTKKSRQEGFYLIVCEEEQVPDDKERARARREE